MDYKELLKKYIKHVDDCEGSMFLYEHSLKYSEVKFTEEEKTVLKEIERELKEEIK